MSRMQLTKLVGQHKLLRRSHKTRLSLVQGLVQAKKPLRLHRNLELRNRRNRNPHKAPQEYQNQARNVQQSLAHRLLVHRSQGSSGLRSLRRTSRRQHNLHRNKLPWVQISVQHHGQVPMHLSQAPLNQGKLNPVNQNRDRLNPVRRAQGTRCHAQCRSQVAGRRWRTTHSRRVLAMTVRNRGHVLEGRRVRSRDKGRANPLVMAVPSHVIIVPALRMNVAVVDVVRPQL